MIPSLFLNADPKTMRVALIYCSNWKFLNVGFPEIFNNFIFIRQKEEKSIVEVQLQKHVREKHTEVCIPFMSP